jgi:N-acetylglucosamine kinase-like BadF-type ATPase
MEISFHTLIVESGATKTDWIVMDDKCQVIHRFSTVGMNINYTSPEHFERLIFEFNNSTTICSPNTIRSIFFYGAGCGNENNQQRVKEGFSRTFAHANIQVYSDLMAACHALCGKKTGIVAILGTGSSSCLYDGSKMIDKAPSLGYLLGDEGSGTHLGKLFVIELLNHRLDPVLATDFETEYQIQTSEIVRHIYSLEMPNLWLSSLSPFVGKYQYHEQIRKICLDAFNQFFQKNILYYADYQVFKISFIGSIAWHFRPLLEQVAAQYQLSIGNILVHPIEQLILYYSQKKHP